MDKLTKSFFALSLLGLALAIYHGYESMIFYGNNGCFPILGSNCGLLAQSPLAYIFGIPLWVTGVFWFPLTLVLGLWFVRRDGELPGFVFIPVLLVGDIFTLYLWYLELNLLDAICSVCVSMYVVNYAMTLLCIPIARRQ